MRREALRDDGRRVSPHRPRRPRRLRVVLLGGGTGLPQVLSGLSAFAPGGQALPPLEFGAVIAATGLRPRPVLAPGALEAIRRADLAVLGPGSLHQCVLASLTAPGVAPALRASGALRILVQNLVTEPGARGAATATDHVRAITSCAGRVVDVVLADRDGVIGHPSAGRYADAGQVPIVSDRRELAALGVLPVEADLLAPGEKLRHDARKLAAALLAIAVEASVA